MFLLVYDIYYDIHAYDTHGIEVGWRKEEASGRRKEDTAVGVDARLDKSSTKHG